MNINTHVIKAIYIMEEIMDINVILDQAIEETKCLNDGEEFLLRDLFKGYIWNRISRKDRLLLGTLFLNKVNTGITNILISEKSSSGQQKYILKKGA